MHGFDAMPGKKITVPFKAMYMARILLIAVLLLSLTSVSAQNKRFIRPDYKKISKTINKTGSPLNYAVLMERYRTNDTTLTREEYHLLYFGYSLQPDYRPDSQSAYSDSLLKLMRLPEVGASQYDVIIRLADKVLETNPFDMRYLDPVIYAYRMKGNEEIAQKLEFRLGRIVETIFNSGDGFSEKTAFHVIAISHEYDLLRALGFRYGGQQRLTKAGVDYLKVEPNDYGIEGMFFSLKGMANQ